jgi:hypothetical protein
VITNIVPATLQGTASLDYAADGVCWTIVAPSANILADGVKAGPGNSGAVVL